MKINDITIQNIAARAYYAGGNWTAKISAEYALEKAIDSTELVKRTASLLSSCDGDVIHAVRLAIKDQMEIEANYYDSTGFEIYFKE